MRKILGLLLTTMVSSGAIGTVHSRRVDNASASISSLPTHTKQKCEIQDAVPCHITNDKEDYIRFVAPPEHDSYVCFDSPPPFDSATYRIPKHQYRDVGPVVLQPPPTPGTEFPYHTQPHPCDQSSDQGRNSSRVIIDP